VSEANGVLGHRVIRGERLVDSPFPELVVLLGGSDSDWSVYDEFKNSGLGPPDIECVREMFFLSAPRIPTPNPLVAILPEGEMEVLLLFVELPRLIPTTPDSRAFQILCSSPLSSLLYQEVVSEKVLGVVLVPDVESCDILRPIPS